MPLLPLLLPLENFYVPNPQNPQLRYSAANRLWLVYLASLLPWNPPTERLLNLCREHLSKNQPEAAIQSCQQAVTAHQQIQDRAGEAKSTVNLGIAYSRNGQYSQAISVLETALKLAREAKERRVEAIALRQLGITYGASGQFQQATEFLQQALSVAQEIKDAEVEKEIRQILSEAEQKLGSPQKTEADRLLQQGIQQFRSNQYPPAIESWLKALIIYRETGDLNGEANTLGYLANAYYSLEQYPNAAETYYKRGYVFIDLGEPQKAIEDFNQAIKIKPSKKQEF
jgi:tetratricopeptide (TPR) repeat protein